MRVELGKLAEGSSKEDVRKTVEQFKKDNADKFTQDAEKVQMQKEKLKEEN